MRRFLFLLALPLALEAAPAPDAKTLPLVPRHELTVGKVQKALQSVQDKRGRPTQFAVSMPTDLRLTEGRWDDLDADTARWRLRLRSPDALSLNLQLADVKLPPSAELWLYDINGRVTQGPYTYKQISKNGRLWTAITTGEEAVLELQVAQSERAKAQMRIVEINHGFLPFSTPLVPAKSGACNVDAICPEGDAWRDEMRAVARITVGGRCFCTGQLVNNVRQDLTPYFLTADHCGFNNTGECAAPPESLVAYWNYQTSQCGGTPDGDLSQNQSGSTLIATSTSSDFTLLRLSQPPSAAFNVYFAGWNNATAAPQSGAGLHHPQGDERRIAIFSTAAASVVSQGIQSWQVRWSRGITEQGSSGSGLWDQNHLVVGVLSHGDVTCDNPGGTDQYGRLDAAWTTNPAPGGQLKAHLDPDNTGATTLAGIDGSGTPPVNPPGADDDSSGVLLGGGAFGGSLLIVLLGFSGLRRLRRG